MNADDLALLRLRHPDVLAGSSAAPRPCFYQGFEALVAIETGQVIAGRLPPAAPGIIESWVARRRDALLANWTGAALLEPLEKVPGADVDER